MDTFFLAQSEQTEITPVIKTDSQPTKPSVAALTAIIQDLTVQRRKLDITIQVLTRRLQEVLSKELPT